MKVLLISALFPPDTGGSATAFYQLFHQLCSDSSISKVLVLCEMINCYPEQKRLNAKGRLLRFLPPLGRMNGYDGKSRAAKAYLVIRRSLALFIVLPFLTRIHKINVIHFHCTFLHLAGKRRNRLMELALRLSPGIKVCEIKDNRGVPLNLKAADFFLANSKQIYRETLARNPLNGSNIQYLPVAIDSRFLNVKANPRKGSEQMRLPEKFFCFIGDLSTQKGIFPLLEAHQSLLKSSGYELSLVMAGRDKTGGRIRQYTNDRTIWLGSLPHEKALHVIGLSRFLILPSFSEGIPRVCLEAMALGIPVIYPPGIEEFEEHIPGFMLKRIDINEITEKIKWLMSVKPKQEYPIQNHDSDVIYQKVKSIYDPDLFKTGHNQ